MYQERQGGEEAKRQKDTNKGGTGRLGWEGQTKLLSFPRLSESKDVSKKMNEDGERLSFTLNSFVLWPHNLRKEML